jgi:hypothetical protein
MQETWEMGVTSQVQFWEKQVTVNPYKVFIYSQEQLSDKNVTRQDQFREDLQGFLRLNTPIINFNDVPKVNANKETFPEYIDICDPNYLDLKMSLLKIGKKSSYWIRAKFVKSNDVVVSGEDFFAATVRKWGEDPCKARYPDRARNGEFDVPKVTAQEKKAMNLGYINSLKTMNARPPQSIFSWGPKNTDSTKGRKVVVV